MEWLQTGILIGIFVVWAVAVLVVLAILSMSRDPDDSRFEQSGPMATYRDSVKPFEISTNSMLGVGD